MIPLHFQVKTLKKMVTLKRFSFETGAKDELQMHLENILCGIAICAFFVQAF